jgi:hypothetical protein
MTSKVMKYNCECCGYATQNKSNFQRHTKTKKHQRNIGLCVENLHEHYSTSDDCQDAEYFEPEEIARMVFVNWDGDNDRLQEMMDSEEQPVNDGVKRNCMWVEKLKEKANWKRGETINFYNKSMVEGIFISYIHDTDGGFCDVINEDGFLMVQNEDKLCRWRLADLDKTGRYTQEEKNKLLEDLDILEECDCVYNDNVRYELELEANGGYLMK